MYGTFFMWECTERRSGNGCKAKIVLNIDNVFQRQVNEHSHPCNPEKVAVVKSRAGMKRAASQTVEKTQNILTDNLAGLPEAVMAKMPNAETLRGDIRRQRRPNDAEVPAFNDTMFAIPHPYTLSSTGEQFLLYDNQQLDRILLSGTQQSIDYLGMCEYWFMDGTFSSSPVQFTQLYSVHGFNAATNIVRAYALLPNKAANTYVQMLEAIQRLTNNAAPQL